MRTFVFFIITLCLVGILLTGCRTKYIPVPVETVDSIVIRDTIIDVQLVPYRDSVEVTPTEENPDSVSSLLTNPYAWSWAQWYQGKLHHSLGIWPGKLTPIRVPYYYERVRKVEVPKIVEVEKPLTRWQKLKMELGGIAFGVCVALLAILIGMIFKKRMVC